MNPTTVRNLLLSLGLATGLGASTNGCSSHQDSPPQGGAGGASAGAGGATLPGTGGFCGNCLGQNLADAVAPLDATGDSDRDAAGDAMSVDPGDAGTDQSDPNGG
jgi:hypothetical protein